MPRTASAGRGVDKLVPEPIGHAAALHCDLDAS